ncbi:uncharacterized protein LOC130796852 [Amaranthus tricolor]|uniref:uncharacterized protein LOC130796852 n=1 Tax=Amaranthus tricolor TaxID=29722 RepID=UPI00258CBA96|nr:uncharacterized protein LOC130796852 [Amaranthus tricolor]
MESQVIRRRIDTISGHLAVGIITEDVTAPNSHLFPLNCSSNPCTSLRRLDNRMHYGRQSSASQGYFMRQAINPVEQGNPVTRPAVCSAKRVNEAKGIASEPPLYSRPGSTEPLFSRPVEEESYCSYIGSTESFEQYKVLPTSECPTVSILQEKQVTSTRNIFSSQNGSQWLPRINVVESRTSHVITVELPGVKINDIRVEIDDKNLIVRGKRTMKWWRSSGCGNDSSTTYHRQEISQGPYRLMWPLPTGVNKNSVSAELVEGILHITIPKL